MSEIHETVNHLKPKIVVILFTRPAAVLHEYLNDELGYFVTVFR